MTLRSGFYGQARESYLPILPVTSQPHDVILSHPGLLRTLTSIPSLGKGAVCHTWN